VDFADLPPALTLTTDSGGDITNFLGNWHGLSIHGFYGVWNAPDATLVIPNAARCAFHHVADGHRFTPHRDSITPLNLALSQR